MEIHERLAVISGASRGIGRATALEMCRRGARVVLLARSAGLLETLVHDIQKSGGRARAYAVDLNDEVAVEELGRKILADEGIPDYLVHCAGAGRFLFLDETPSEEIRTMASLPYLAACFLTRAFLPAMRGRNSGVIVQVTSPAAYLPWPGATVYASARWAVRGLHEALRADLHTTHVRSMLVVPGKVATSYFETNAGSEERLPAIARWMPLLQAEEVAACILRGIERGKSEVFAPASLRLLHILLRICPGVLRTILYRGGYSRRSP